MATNAEGAYIATPPPLVCQNCGVRVFNSSRFGHRYIHVVTNEIECGPKKKWRTR